MQALADRRNPCSASWNARFVSRRVTTRDLVSGSPCQQRKASQAFVVPVCDQLLDLGLVPHIC
eukprot:SAG11_NODE_36606_length_260_cov_3.074534_1_plen_62_part_01